MAEDPEAVADGADLGLELELVQFPVVVPSADRRENARVNLRKSHTCEHRLFRCMGGSSSSLGPRPLELSDKNTQKGSSFLLRYRSRNQSLGYAARPDLAFLGRSLSCLDM